MSEPKSAKTLGACERRPFSERTWRRLERRGEAPEGRTLARAAWRSGAERVGLSARGNGSEFGRVQVKEDHASAKVHR